MLDKHALGECDAEFSQVHECWLLLVVEANVLLALLIGLLRVDHHVDDVLASEIT